METRPDVLKAIVIAKMAHHLQRYGDRPYFDHVEAVAKSFATGNFIAVGYLHDVIEDSILTRQDLVDLGFNKEIVDAVDLLTRTKDDGEGIRPYYEYIHKIVESRNYMAIRVKLADIRYHLRNRETLSDSLEKRYLMAEHRLTYAKIDIEESRKEGNVRIEGD